MGGKGNKILMVYSVFVLKTSSVEVRAHCIWYGHVASYLHTISCSKSEIVGSKMVTNETWLGFLYEKALLSCKFHTNDI